ncbi:MAG TPA: sugar phosphate isomerase/epimerase [Sedimentisphaerales bacterium]|nr:sugar phosphate isomerase/epimerase [Sedimentisphaerales bacterium]
MSRASPSRNLKILRYLSGICILLLIGGCASNAKKQQITFTKYPHLKLGFTTKNFFDYLPVTEQNIKTLIDYAGDRGYAWIELRDPNATLSLDECRNIAEYARARNIEVAYAINTGLLDSDFGRKFDRAVHNAVFFDGPKVLRAAAGGNKFLEDMNKKGWTAEELAQLTAKANQAASSAERRGLRFVVENGSEALKGDGRTYFGLTEFFEKANPNVGWQFDTANFFSGSRVHTKPEDAGAFVEKNIGRLAYIHLKTSRDGQAQPVLGDNELDFDVVFSLMSEHNVPYVAIELYGTKNIGQVYRNQKKSVAYLKKRGFVSVN